MNLEEAVGMMRRQEESEKVGRVPPIELFESDLLDDEEDVGVLRLMRLQAALKEKRIVESEG
jgi:hypothetical protein